MAMRMTGMMSGMDTESIIQELVAARRKKVDVKKKEQTRINWKQEIWKELNTKLKGFSRSILLICVLRMHTVRRLLRFPIVTP